MAESAIKRTPSDTERRARIFTVATLAAVQNGTSGVLAGGKHTHRRAAWATPRTGVQGHPRRSRARMVSTPGSHVDHPRRPA